jgi:hypothetical protein
MGFVMSAASKAEITLSNETWTLISATNCTVQASGGCCRIAFGSSVPATKNYGLRLQSGDYLTNNEGGNCYALAEYNNNVKVSVVEF